MKPKKKPHWFYTSYAPAVNQGELASSVDVCRNLVRLLPVENYCLLEYLVAFLLEVAQHEATNKMSATALAIVFGPNVFRCSVGLDGLKEQHLANQIVCSFIEHPDSLFPGLQQQPARPPTQSSLAKVTRPASLTVVTGEEEMRAGAIVARGNTETREGGAAAATPGGQQLMVVASWQTDGASGSEGHLETREAHVEADQTHGKETHGETGAAHGETAEARVETRETHDNEGRVETGEARVETREARVETREARVETRETHDNNEGRVETRKTHIETLKTHDNEGRVETGEARVETSKTHDNEGRVETGEARVETSETHETGEARVETSETHDNKGRVETGEARVETSETHDNEGRVETRKTHDNEARVETRKTHDNESRLRRTARQAAAAAGSGGIKAAFQCSSSSGERRHQGCTPITFFGYRISDDIDADHDPPAARVSGKVTAAQPLSHACHEASRKLGDARELTPGEREARKPAATSRHEMAPEDRVAVEPAPGGRSSCESTPTDEESTPVKYVDEVLTPGGHVRRFSVEREVAVSQRRRASAVAGRMFDRVRNNSMKQTTSRDSGVVTAIPPPPAQTHVHSASQEVCPTDLLATWDRPTWITPTSEAPPTPTLLAKAPPTPTPLAKVPPTTSSSAKVLDTATLPAEPPSIAAPAEAPPISTLPAEAPPIAAPAEAPSIATLPAEAPSIAAPAEAPSIAAPTEAPPTTTTNGQHQREGMHQHQLQLDLEQQHWDGVEHGGWNGSVSAAARTHRHGHGHHTRKSAVYRYTVREQEYEADAKPSHAFLDIHHQSSLDAGSPSLSKVAPPFMPALDLTILHEHGDGSDPIPMDGNTVSLRGRYICAGNDAALVSPRATQLAYPSHGDKLSRPDIKKYLSELTKTKRELKSLKEEYHISRFGVMPKVGVVADVKPSVDRTFTSTIKKLEENRKDGDRPSALDSMSRGQVQDEKLSMQKALLNYEHIHGRPRSKQDKVLMRPLYDRYRHIKRMLAQPSPDLTELQPILEDADEDCPMVFTPADAKLSWQASAVSLEDEEGATVQCMTPTSIGRDDRDGVSPVKEQRALFSMRGAASLEGNLHEASMAELMSEQQLCKAEKKQLRSKLHGFEQGFLEMCGRKVQREDRGNMQLEYQCYKTVKAKLRLLEALLSKHERTMTL
ncbi:PREDICTED: uncharacterized protein LOC106812857 [Priapulus caudatus]|uniref:Uncharacterized protein LOC106812857 n=1 Tax=Priapulus caudatus TaxID=37621 RepID=A0ABM1EJG0_PRICU|nr:PREDICTED: uncharacterized protein LOC106812857 [Priapulus caudatus]